MPRPGRARRLAAALAGTGAVALAAPAVAGGVSLPWVFADHMVLQRDRAIPVWGRAAPDTRIEVSFGSARASGAAGTGGTWRVELPAMKASDAPRTVRVTAAGNLAAEFSDVLVGDVWLAAGQSNMEWPLAKADGGPEAARDAGDPLLRLLRRTGRAATSRGAWPTNIYADCTPERFFSGTWTRDTPETAASFSAVGWWFGRRLRGELGVPVGIIQVAVGGAGIEAFTSLDGLRAHPAQRAIVAPGTDWMDCPAVGDFPRVRARDNLGAWFRAPAPPRPGHPFEPGFIHRGAIGPLDPLPIRGVLWYQGESNATLADNVTPVPADAVRAGLDALLADWRRRRGEATPFLMVQLPGLNRPWEMYRDVQRRVAVETPGVGLVTTLDLGHPTDVHPRTKKPVADRLARIAMGAVYGRDPPGSGPLARDVVREGRALRVRFAFGDGLATADGRPPSPVEIAGADGRWLPAHAVVDGTDLVASNDRVAEPRAVRYAWAPNPPANLVNGAGLPASPFHEVAE